MRGIGYIYFLVLFTVIISLIIGISTLLLDQQKILKLDLAGLQAGFMADSAAAYSRKNIALPHNTISSLTLDELLAAPGVTQQLHLGGFKIVENKGKIYFIGFAGITLADAKGLPALQYLK